MLRARLVRLVLVLCLTASTQGLLFAQGAFVVNQEWIAETLCVNRDRPEMDCDGMCELMRQMDDHHEHPEDNNAARVEVALSVHAAALDVLTVPADDSADHSAPAATDRVVSGREAVGDVFRPPRKG